MLRNSNPIRPSDRRRISQSLIGATLALLWPFAGSAQAAASAIRVGLTPAFLHDQHGLLEKWRLYLEKKLGRPVQFIKRDSYRETIDLLHQEQLDFAWVCDTPYILLKKQVRLLAVPMFGRRPVYRAYLLVPASDQSTTSIKQLRNTVFAYSDPDSNTGYLVPRHALLQLGENPATFFRKTFFTQSHRKVVEAVAVRLVQGGSVDSFVWETLAKVEPELTAKTRIVEKSGEFGFPPFVANRHVNDVDFAAFQNVLLGMEHDPIGAVLLRRLNLDGFTQGEPKLYEGVAQMMLAFENK
jgi:phosphonate transport system substrate-binding protein